MNETNKNILIGGLERCLDDGIIKMTKRIISTYSKHDWETASTCLKQWEAEGKLKILKPLDEVSDEEDVVEMLTYISTAFPARRSYNAEQFERILIGRINQFKKYDTLDRRLILGGLENCLAVAISCLNKWQREGKCEILKPLDEANDNDVVARLLKLTH